MTEIDADLVALPKAHLHLHLTGSIRPSTLHELAAAAGIAVPALPGHFPDWAAFLNTYRLGKQVLRDGDDLARVTAEVVDDAADDGVTWVEISVSPTGYRSITGSDAATLDVVCAAAVDAARTRGIGAGIVVAADRVRDADDGDQLAELAATRAARGVVGFGLGGDEAAPSRPFATAAAIARQAGLAVVPHAGELAGPESVREAIAYLAPERIMHGVRAAEDPRLLSEIVERGIVLDVCPSSNAALGVVPSVAEHPLPTLLRAGVACTLNADDTLVFATSLAEEYHRARHILGLTDDELTDLAHASLAAARWGRTERSR